MKGLIKITLPIVFACMTAVSAQAQNRQLKYADKQFVLENFAHAGEMYGKAYAAKPKYLTARQAALSFQNVHDYENSFKWWEKTISHEEASKEDYSNYLSAAMKIDQDKSIEDLLEGSPYNEFDFPEINFPVIRELQKKEARVKLTPVQELNSDGSDYGLVESKSGVRYFTSDRGSENPSLKPSIRLDAKNNLFSEEKNDFNDRPYFGIFRADDQGNIQSFNSDVTAGMQFSDPSLMESKGLVFYTLFRDIKKIKKKREFDVNPEIYFGKIDAEGNISESKPFPLNKTISHGVMTPFVDEASKRIYFASDMAGGNGGYDLYYVTYDDDLNFGQPVNLGPDINTAKNESHPFKLADRLYFSSKGHPGLGGMDIFTAIENGSSYSQIENMGIPFNSVRDDFAFTVTEKGKRYLSSDRQGGMGMDDIYLIEDLNKKLIAKVIDCDGNLITADFESRLQNKNNNATIGIERIASGAISADLDLDTNFKLEIHKKGHFSILDDQLSTIGFEGDTLYREYKLFPIPYRTPVYVDIVYYDLDKSAIRKDAEPVLDKIANLMAEYDFLDLVVNSHTDSRASNAYNEALSNRRADAVRDYLSNFEIPGNRVKLEWFGEEKRVNDCGDGVPCPETEHQLNRRSELVLEAFSDPTKDYKLPSQFIGRDICDPADIFTVLNEEINSLPTIYFDFDKADLRPIHKKELERVNLMMQRIPSLDLLLQGHTDQRGSDDYNMKLSERRAKAVEDYLSKRGLEKRRIVSEWIGESKPINDCASGDCSEQKHQENRRTELKLQKEKK